MSAGEVVLVLVIALLALGARRLPETGRLLGKGVRDFHRALNEARDSIASDAPTQPPRSRGRSRLID